MYRDAQGVEIGLPWKQFRAEIVYVDQQGTDTRYLAYSGDRACWFKDNQAIEFKVDEEVYEEVYEEVVFPMLWDNRWDLAQAISDHEMITTIANHQGLVGIRIGFGDDLK